MDEPIDAIGSAKAQALAGALPVSAQVWTSTAARAVQTAEALKLDAKPDEALNDCGYGRWAGRRLADLQEEEPDAVLAWLKELDAVPHGGESLLGVQHRVRAWMSRIGKNIDSVTAVTHPTVVRMAILVALDAPIESFWRIDLNPLSLTTLRFSHDRWTLVSAGTQIGT